MHEYAQAYSDGTYGKKDITFSVMALEKIELLHQSIAALGQELSRLSGPEKKAILAAAQGSLYFTHTDYIDLFAFASRLTQPSSHQVLNALQTFVLGHVNTGAYVRSGGLSFWFPSFDLNFRDYGAQYRLLNFHRRTGWGDVLERLKSN